MNDPRRIWALRGASGGAAAGAGLLTFLLFAAGDRVAPESGAAVAWAYTGFAGLSALLGAGLGWLHGGQSAQPLPRTTWEVMRREGAMGLRLGFVFGLLYAAVALGIFLDAGPTMPVWFLAQRAGLTVTVSTLVMSAVGFLTGLLKARSTGG